MAKSGSDIAIRIAADFVGKKAFKQADNSVASLIKSTAKLAGGLFTVAKAQKAMMSYIADEKATKVLAQNLKNLGLAYAIPTAEEFIKTMQKQTGILDDELRPAYAQLARVTGSTLDTQKLMALAFDVSAGTGKDYASVIDALSQAYVGNNKSLKSLNIGLSQADLKTKSFAEITAILNKQFAGSGEASLDSYAGKMALLQVAASDASETIGKGLLDAITTASGPGGFPTFIKAIEKSAQIISDLATGTGRLIAIFDIVASPSEGIGDWFKKYRALRARWDREDLEVMKERAGIANNTSSYFEKQAKDSILAAKIAKTQKQLANDRLKAEKQIAAEKKAQAALDKASLALSTANNIFDLERIGIAAAMQNATLTENEKKRLEIKQAIFALEDAIDSKDTERITKQTGILNGLVSQFSILQKQDILLGQIKTAFDSLGLNKDLINLKNLQDALDLLTKMSKVTINGVQTGTSTGAKTVYTPTLSNDIYNSVAGLTFADVGAKPFSQGMTLAGAGITPLPDISNLTFADVGAKPFTTPMSISGQNPVVTVNIAGDLQKLIDSITFETQNASANGTPVMLNRNATNLAW